MLWGLALPLIAALALPRTFAVSSYVRSIPPPTVVEPAPKTEPAPVREPLVPRSTPPPVAPITLPDEVVVRAVDTMRPAFAACFKRAMATEILDVPLKIRLRVEVDATGRITTATTDAPVATLDGCLRRVGHGLAFGAPGRPAVVDVPLFFR